MGVMVAGAGGVEGSGAGGVVGCGAGWVGVEDFVGGDLGGCGREEEEGGEEEAEGDGVHF